MTRKSRRDALKRRARARMNARANPEPPDIRAGGSGLSIVLPASHSQDDVDQEAFIDVHHALRDPKNWRVIGGKAPETAQEIEKVLRDAYGIDSFEVTIDDDGAQFSIRMPVLSTVNKNYRTALRLRDEGDMDEALKYIDEALRELPGNTEVSANRNAILVELDRLDEAMKGCRKILEADPDHEHTYQNMGIIMSITGKYSEAISYYDKAIKCNKKCGGEAEHLAHTYYKKATALLNMERFKEALVECDNALRIDPDHVPAYRGKARILLNLGDIAGAQEWIRKAVKMEREYE